MNDPRTPPGIAAALRAYLRALWDEDLAIRAAGAVGWEARDWHAASRYWPDWDEAAVRAQALGALAHGLGWAQVRAGWEVEAAAAAVHALWHLIDPEGRRTWAVDGLVWRIDPQHPDGISAEDLW